MVTIPSSLPGHLIDWYWNEVENHLVNTHNVPRDAAKAGIRRFRKRMARHGVGDILYHADADQTAEGIVTGGHIPQPTSP
jgi:cytosine/adenosine deaminase-related metal-dependent hydrolase